MRAAGLSRRSQNLPVAPRDARFASRDHPKSWTGALARRTLRQVNVMRKLVLVSALILPALLAAPPARAQGPDVGILEVSVDPASPVTFGQELKLRVRVANRGSVSAKGVVLEARAGAQPVGRVDVKTMGPGEQRTITLATHFKPAGAECVSVAPLVAPDSPVKAGPARLACLTPGCYSLSERPGS